MCIAGLYGCKGYTPYTPPGRLSAMSVLMPRKTAQKGNRALTAEALRRKRHLLKICKTNV